MTSYITYNVVFSNNTPITLHLLVPILLAQLCYQVGHPGASHLAHELHRLREGECETLKVRSEILPIMEIVSTVPGPGNNVT
ncbi:hypothetical protein DPMN_161550 [Dreissena polymorpha]|uniref:Uncharacterized protein n=1 Tax=Dreissena polymorpha TaxID=45954 RepID=A0A9D4EPY0_DREPO|nr:hypothetical protein DPMN_161550 [Dreissena polymorpha]